MRVHRILREAALEEFVGSTLVAQLALGDASPAEQVRLLRLVAQRFGQQGSHFFPATFVTERQRLVQDAVDVIHWITRRIWRGDPRVPERAT